MICVESARKSILDRASRTVPENRNVLSSVGYVLAQDIVSEIDIPSFDNSAMDGFALLHSDIESGNQTFNLLDEVKAGDNPNFEVKPGFCAPIYTGAPIPKGADTVVMVEKTSTANTAMTLEENYTSSLGKHIRRTAEQVKTGEVALFKGTLINPSGASYLSALGITEASVYSAPVVKIITTGNEIIEPGKTLNLGQIYESNSTALITLLKQQGVPGITHVVGRDTNEELLETLKDAEDFNIVILTGGVSVGKYDLVADCLEKIGVTKIFHKIAQKPGKPFYFGTLNNTLIFALPGNPSAVITSYYEYIYPCVRKMMGWENPSLNKAFLPLLSEVQIKSNRSNFLKGKIHKKGVEVLSGQGSHILNSLAIADCFIYLPSGKNVYEEGENVEVHMLPK